MVRPGIENLKNISKRSDFIEISSKGGKNSSPKEWWKKKHFIEKLKKGALKDDDIDWALTKATNSQAFALDLVTDLDSIDRNDLSTGQKIFLTSTKTSIMKAIHGEKLRTENINININSTTEELERRLMGEDLNGSRQPGKTPKRTK